MTAIKTNKTDVQYYNITKEEADKFDFQVRPNQRVCIVAKHDEVNKDGLVYTLIVVIKRETSTLTSESRLVIEHHMFGAGVQIQMNYSIAQNSWDFDVCERYARAHGAGKLYKNYHLVFTKSPEMMYQKGYLKWDGFYSGRNLSESLAKIGF